MEDAEIIALLGQRRESALDGITHRYGRMLKNLAGRILPTAQDAEECINDALLDIWNTIPPKCPESMASYTAMLTRRRAVDSFLASLTAEDRLLFVGRYFAMESIQSLAEQNKVTKNTINIRLSRIRKRMKNWLEERSIYI